ncbi:MAG: ISAs1 family transposase [Thioploca sp.]|nr:ISAs1 family transposase [Thioploca sp.]
MRGSGGGNEIKAIPDLLALLDIQGATVTIEVMGTQKAIAAPIVEGGADYVLALKANHPNWYEEVTLGMNTGYDAGQLSVLETVAKDHGRLETRCYTLSTRRDWLDGRANWAGLNALGMVESRREIGAKDRNGVVSSTVPPIPPCFV